MKITRRFEIDAGHRVFGHEGKCNHPHGHRYVIELTCQGKKLDDLGRVIDFSEVKRIFGEWVDSHWDHAFIVNVDDMVIRNWLIENNFRHYIMANNPTAENMADYLLNSICPTIFSNTNVSITGVKVWETPNCTAEARL
jgi:6-pyruvoyltetrahydropterin/6-carboxytetrahydropterin synthase